jgi:asparagine synthase (glutamine-hydrolysing)
MCGIAGIVYFNSYHVEEEDIALLVESIKHRGPDGQGLWFSNKQNVAFGHTRLSILDLSSAGKQPMSYMDDRFHITMNGEIYNFIEIREELKSKNYLFKTETDTEVVLAAFHEWGENMLSRFNGMWAFAIYDEANNSLFLSRDRYGVKPFYYYLNDEKLIFASEVQAIHKVLGNQHPLDELVIKDISTGSFFNHGTSRTYLKNVNTLPGGFNITVKNNKVIINQWYHLKKVTVPKSYKKQAELLKELISDACKLRLRSDVAIGTCLSGGVDSGSITSIINKFNLNSEERFNNYSHRSFCASFPGTPIDEKESAQLLASKLGSNLDVIDIVPPSKTELEEAMKECDGPMHALAFFPIWGLYKYIKEQGITVTLDGQGPDEMLGGYRPIQEALQAAIQLRKPFWFYDIYKTYAVQGESSQFSSRKYAKEALKKVFSSYIHKLKIKGLSIIPGMTGNSSSILNEPLENRLKPVKLVNGFNNTLDSSLFVQFFQAPLPGILNQYDRCSMAHGVECRMPFMDYRVVEFIFSLPVDSKVGGGYTKRILREAVKDILPDEVRLNKFKIGFNAPIVDWFKGPLKDFMLEIMTGNEFSSSIRFDGKTLLANYRKFLDSEKPQWDEAWQFWPPVHLTWWLKHNKIS